MVSKEHKRVVKALRELAEKYNEYSKVEQNKPNMIYGYNYVADLWAKTKNGKIDVYEVWYGESIDGAIGDIFWSALIPNIRHLHIVCVNKRYREPWTKEGASGLFNNVSKHINNKDKRRAYDCLYPPYIAEVTEEELKDFERLKKHLKKELEFE